jgi:hypothetical protein
MAEKNTFILAAGALAVVGAGFYLYKTMKKASAAELPANVVPPADQPALRSTTIAQSFGSAALRGVHNMQTAPASSSTDKGYIPAAEQPRLRSASIAQSFAPAMAFRTTATPSGILGLSTETISEFQTYLQALGYPNEGNGDMTDNTVQAIKVFQANHAMPQSGVLDQATMDVIRSAYDAMQASK